MKDLFLTLIGAIAGLLVTLAYQRWERARESDQDRQRYDKTNLAMEAVSRRFGRLHLVQAGWNTTNGFFADGTAELILNGEFKLEHPELTAIRAEHHDEWVADKLTDGQQIGIKSIWINRQSDDHTKEGEGHNGRLQLDVHSFQFFDHLATHRLRLEGTQEEQRVLNAFAAEAGPLTPVTAFPNPCSVGVSLFCENGAYLALPRRTKKIGAGGYVEGGKVFNAVGETATPDDFEVKYDGSRRASPDKVARRGLNQEMGFSEQDIRDCSKLGIHSFAWSSYILDHKFFGLAVTPLSRAEVEFRWQHAKDRHETEGEPDAELRPRLRFQRVLTESECLALLRDIRDQASDWAPEAVFSTVISLLVLARISLDDLVEVFEVQ